MTGTGPAAGAARARVPRWARAVIAVVVVVWVLGTGRLWLHVLADLSDWLGEQIYFFGDPPPPHGQAAAAADALRAGLWGVACPVVVVGLLLAFRQVQGAVLCAVGGVLCLGVGLLGWAALDPDPAPAHCAYPGAPAEYCR